ncbi:molybdopterin dinucleotide binding domain-containing protein [Bacillus sp. V3-13]|uniref:molybdopterin dinucleotide binding domain-containing protein n=1 Tax=Bacillus sp. V3-13 TaxID=2053728 RepID=UPI0021528743|nr:molybdopterin dinucleotide binding domain-containing protein [Bacillus sp. V3-13]
MPHESKWSQPELAEKYPFTLLSLHPLRSNHSQHYHLLNGQKRIKVEISPDIAEKRKLADNDFVRVWNERGEINGYVSIMKQAHPGTINIDEGTGRKYGGAVNLLTSSDVSDNGLGSTVYDCLVNIEKV